MNARTRSLGGWAVMLAAALVCALGGWSYTQARGDDTLAYAKARDAATADGRSRLARLNSMDGTSAASVKSGLTAWLAASTGPLRTRSWSAPGRRTPPSSPKPGRPRAARSPTPPSRRSTYAPEQRC